MQFQGREVLVIRRPYRRSMTLHMRPHQPIRVTTAMRVTDDQILEFLHQKSAWIRKNDVRFEKVPPPPVRQARPGEMWMFKGGERVLTEAVTLLKHPFVVWSEEAVTVYWPESHWPARDQMREQALRLIEESLKQEAEGLLRQRVQHFANQMQLFPSRIKLMQAKTRWGSCSSRGNLNFNWRLVGAPLEVVDSIVVHELAHLKHMNHSEQFWSLVARFDPGHEQADQWLKDHQHRL